MASQDKELGIMFNYIGNFTLRLGTDYFASLAKLIVGQKLSVKSAQTIWERLLGISDDIKPEIIRNLLDDVIRSTGISRTKTKYLKDLSKSIMENEVDLNSMEHLSNDDIISVLTSIKGIRNWTAEMFLIFSLVRLDVFSNGDIGL